MLAVSRLLGSQGQWEYPENLPGPSTPSRLTEWLWGIEGSLQGGSEISVTVFRFPKKTQVTYNRNNTLCWGRVGRVPREAAGQQPSQGSHPVVQIHNLPYPIPMHGESRAILGLRVVALWLSRIQLQFWLCSFPLPSLLFSFSSWQVPSSSFVTVLSSGDVRVNEGEDSTSMELLF
jgi:hypothetical protein